MASSCSALQQRYSSRLADVQRQLRLAANSAPLPSPPSLSDDPLLLELIACFLSAKDVVNAIATCSMWAGILVSDEVWADKCSLLWSDKLYVPGRFLDRAAMTRVQAFFYSKADGERCVITAEELCAFEWSVRMKACAGGSWIELDPWWQGEASIPPRFYQPDGNYVDESKGNGTWRFPRAAQGIGSSLVRHSREHIVFPTFHISRYRWAFVMQNCWALCLSHLPLPARGECFELEDDGEVCARVTVAGSRHEVVPFNIGLPLPSIDGSDDEEMGRGEGTARSRARQADEVSSLLSGGQGEFDPRDAVITGHEELLSSLSRTWDMFERFERAGHFLTHGLGNLARRAETELRAQAEDRQGGADSEDGSEPSEGGSGSVEVAGADGRSAWASSIVTDDELTSQHAVEAGLARMGVVDVDKD